MTDPCTARKRDRHGTVHTCARPSHPAGYHETVDGLLFGPEEANIRYTRIPVRVVRYTEGTTAGIRELAEVIQISGDVKWAPITVRVGPGIAGITTLYPGEFLVQFDDGSVEHYEADKYEALFTERRGIEHGGPVAF